MQNERVDGASASANGQTRARACVRARARARSLAHLDRSAARTPGVLLVSAIAGQGVRLDGARAGNERDALERRARWRRERKRCRRGGRAATRIRRDQLDAAAVAATVEQRLERGYRVTPTRGRPRAGVHERHARRPQTRVWRTRPRAQVCWSAETECTHAGTRTATTSPRATAPTTRVCRTGSCSSGSGRCTSHALERAAPRGRRDASESTRFSYVHAASSSAHRPRARVWAVRGMWRCACVCMLWRTAWFVIHNVCRCVCVYVC